MPKGYTYIMTNPKRTVLYIGVTNDMARRVIEHKSEGGSAFTSQYKCTNLVYYEEYHDIRYAIGREKQLKAWRREWKNKLVTEANPQWLDLAADW